MEPTLVAVDLGAESCRVSLLQWSGSTPEIRLVHRFPNGPILRSTGLHWDLKAIVAGVEEGIRKCSQIAASGIAAIGVDGWAVDYVRLLANRTPWMEPFCYRDERTVAAEAQVHRIVSPTRLYELTGIQLLRLNTVYQLFADNRDGINQGAPWVNLPEYILHFLGGELVAEYTNATHTGLVRLGTHSWCEEIYEALHLDCKAAPKIVDTGTVLGPVQHPISALDAFKRARLIAPACHDTAAAIAGIPAEGDDWAFISSGTWSLVGTTLDQPCASAKAREENFTNLGGAGNQICFLKNVNGMWLVRQCLEEWHKQGHAYELPELLADCERLSPPKQLLHVDAPELMLPGQMPEKINAQLGHRTGAGGHGVRTEAIEIIHVILHSLAARYAEVIREITAITGKKIRRLYIVGGGSRNSLLNRLTADRTGLEVFVGATESTTVGNFAIQLASLDPAGTETSKDAIRGWASRLSPLPERLVLHSSAG